ncbi:hypothetical protein HDV04_005071 [Boothiomyces sp. JEL0838]|nr:hypothetical protein HDV04_005071 [Boothiomyces sp. JEL0838]
MVGKKTGAKRNRLTLDIASQALVSASPLSETHSLFNSVQNQNNNERQATNCNLCGNSASTHPAPHLIEGCKMFNNQVQVHECMFCNFSEKGFAFNLYDHLKSCQNFQKSGQTYFRTSQKTFSKWKSSPLLLVQKEVTCPISPQPSPTAPPPFVQMMNLNGQLCLVEVTPISPCMNSFPSVQPENTRYGEPENTRYGEPENTCYGEPENTRYGGPENTRYGGPENTRYGGPENTRYGDRNVYNQAQLSNFLNSTIPNATEYIDQMTDFSSFAQFFDSQPSIENRATTM